MIAAHSTKHESFSVVPGKYRGKGGARRPVSPEQEQRQFIAGIEFQHLDSMPFLHSVRRSVGKQSLYGAAKRQMSRSLEGAPLGLTAISHDVRRAKAEADANRAILAASETLTVGDLRLSWDDQELKNWAKAKAAQCEKLAVGEYGLFDIETLADSYGFELPNPDLLGESSVIARACDERWWLRRARVAKARVIDQLARQFRMVHAKGQPYCSNELVSLRRKQAKRNRATLAGMQATNEDGQTYTLEELAALSPSNPAIRRNELMVRMKGFESVAELFGHHGLFITLLCPSRFHPMRQVKDRKGSLIRVDPNRKYDGSTPRDAHRWLCKSWELIRSKFDREGIRCYGFRVVEPHHDGSPHWHQLLFFAPDQVRAVKAVVLKYMRRGGWERGIRHRVKFVDIDPSKGSATGYIAKYICKSIDGSHIESDLLGNAGAVAAERICAWASGHGIRQFQQIGGPGVTVWRELRRLDNAEGVTEAARDAADDSDWAAYFLVQGGGLQFYGRDAQKIRPAYWLEENQSTGEILDPVENRYGDPSKGKLFGVQCVTECRYFLSRFYRWTVQRLGEAAKAVTASVKQVALSPGAMSADDMLDLLRGDGCGAAA